MTEEERIDLYTSIVPNERQLKIQQMKYYAFVHYSVNTFTNKEWGNGKADVRRLKQMGDWLKKEDDCVIESSYTVSKDKMQIDISFDRQSVDRIRFSEDTTKSQRIEIFKIYVDDKCVYNGTVVGFSKIAIFDRPVITDSLKLVIEQCRKEPYIESIEVCKTGAYRS